MARCVYRVKSGLTVGDSLVLTVHGGDMYLQEDPNMAAVPSGTSLRGRHCQTVPNTGLMGLLEERGEWQRFRVDLTRRPEVLLFMCSGRPSKTRVYENGGPPPIRYELRRPRQGQLRRESWRETGKQRQGEKRGTVLVNNRMVVVVGGGVRLMQMCSEMSPNQLPPGSSSSVSPTLQPPPPTVPLTPVPKCLGWTSRKQFTPTLIHPYL